MAEIIGGIGGAKRSLKAAKVRSGEFSATMAVTGVVIFATYFALKSWPAGLLYYPVGAFIVWNGIFSSTGRLAFVSLALSLVSLLEPL